MRGAEFDRIQPNSLDNGAKISYNEYNKYRKTISKIVAARLLNAEIHNERKMNMKKTNNKSPMKRIAASATMLAVSATMLGTSTYAWFTMNKTVTVNGMEVRTKVGANLLVCDTNVETDYTTSLSQTRAALLEPVSTIDGKNFAYTVNANARGQALTTPKWYTYGESADPSIANTVAGKTNYDSVFNGVYGISNITSENISLNNTSGSERDGAAYGYVDYTIYLKATNDGTDRYINMTKCNLLKDNAAIDNTGKTAGVNANRAWRVAVFVAGTEAGTTTASPQTGTATSILTLDGAQTFSKKPASGETAAVPDKAMKITTSGETTTYALDEVSYNAPVNIADVGETAGTTGYYKVVVRLWLEGEDDTCNSATYAALNKDYTLDLEFKLQSETGGVTNIGSATA